AAALQDFDGVLTVQWADPRHRAASGGETRFHLTPAGGAAIRLKLSDALANLAIRHFGRRVTLRGRCAQDASGTANMVVDSIAAATPAQAAAVTGTRRALYLLLKFSDDSAVPHQPSFYANLTNPDTPPPGSGIPATLNGFFKKTSWN